MVGTDVTKPILSDVAGSCPVSHQHPPYVPTGGKMVVRPSCHTKDICTCVQIQRSGQSDGRSPWIAEPCICWIVWRSAWKGRLHQRSSVLISRRLGMLSGKEMEDEVIALNSMGDSLE